MSKEGRSSLVLLALLVSGLLVVPLVYLVFAGKFDPIDPDALNRQIAELESTAVAGPAALQARYLMDRDLDLTFLLPDPEYDIRDRTDPTTPDRSLPFVYIVTPANGARKVVVP